MKKHQITYTDFSDSYLLYYGAGCMGDFLASLILFSFNKTHNRVNEYNGPDSFYYEPWSKKWVTRDSSHNQFRNFLAKRTGPDSLGAKRSMLNLATETMGTEFEFMGVKDPGFNYHLNRIMTYEDNELSIILPVIYSILKNDAVPYLFVGENIGMYITDAAQNQSLPNITFIEGGFKEEKHRPLYFLLSLYKNKLHYTNRTLEDFERGRAPFIEEAKHILVHGRNFSIKDNILNAKQYIYVDMLKLVLDNDPQGLDILLLDDIGVQNMLATARKDMFEILDFFDLDINDLPEFDDRKLNEVYDRMKIL